MSADALVCDAARAPVDVMLPMCILQILSFHWCRFLSYSCTVCISRYVRKFILRSLCDQCDVDVLVIISDYYLTNKSAARRFHCSCKCLELNLRGFNYQVFKEYTSRNILRGPRFVVFNRTVIDTDHLTNIVQDYPIGNGANILLHQSDITSGLIVKNINLTHDTPSNESGYLWQIWK